MTTLRAGSAPDVTAVLLVDPRQTAARDVDAARAALDTRQVIVADVVAAGGRGRAMATAAGRATGVVVAFVDAGWGMDAAPVVDRVVGALVPDGGGPVPIALAVGQPPPDSPGDLGVSEPDRPLVGGTLDVLLRPVVELLVPALEWLRRPLDAPVALPRSLLRNVTFADGPAAGLDLIVTVAAAEGAGAVRPVPLEGRWGPPPLVDDPGLLADAVFAAVLPRVTGPVRGFPPGNPGQLAG